jgi:hypothetical protein
MPVGSYLLIQFSAAGSAGTALPVTPDLISTNLTMSGVSGKVVLSNQAAALACGAAATLCTLPSSSIVDLVSYGVSSNAEGGVSANNGVALTSTQGSVRKNNGCLDTDNNNNDFNVVTAPVPRNSASTIVNCSASVPSLSVSGTLSDFGSVIAGSNSASQTYNISGTNLTGAPGTVLVSAPSTDFQVSNNNTSWATTTTVAFVSATLSPTPVYVRFSPQSAGIKTGTVSNNGAGVTAAVNVAVSGTGILPPTPLVTATALTSFGNICLNATTAANSFTISGTNLTNASLSVAALSGFTYSTTLAGTYTSSLSLNQAGGVYSQEIFVKFSPVALQSYNGNIVISGAGAPSINVAATGTGNNNTPTVATSSASAITTIAATLSGVINAIGCTAVTSYGFEYSLISGFTNGTVVSSTNLNAGAFGANIAGLVPSTTYYFKAFALNGGGKAYGIQQAFATAAPVISATPLTAFGSLCLNATSSINSFTIASAGLSNANVTVDPLAGYLFSTTQAGSFTSSLSLVQPGGVYSQIVFVKFSPTAVQSYGGNIIVSGGGANAIGVSVSGSGVNSAATVLSGAASDQKFHSAVVSGSISNIGCSNITSYGIEYSSIIGFASGQGTKLYSQNMSAGNFSASLSGLIQATSYYYKAFAINNGGVSYGSQQSFATASIPDGLVIYSTPVGKGGTLHYSMKNIKPGHYAAKIYNVSGQLVYKKDMILQLKFIDDSFVLPAYIGSGVYSLHIENFEFLAKKVFMIR